jgi:hypothetical protein
MEKLFGIFKKVLIVFVVAVIALVIFALLLPPYSGPGPANGRALLHCRWTIETWKSASTNSPTFDLFQLSQDDKLDTVISFGKDLDPFFKTNFVWGNASNREVVIVCRKQFSDLHNPGIWNSFIPNPAHAVAYSDGTAELISPKQFANLNLNGFVSLSNLAANPAFNNLKQ